MTLAAFPLTEKQWLAQVRQLAQMFGWSKVYHTFNSMRSAEGFPDLVMARERVIFVELKTDAKSSRLSPKQEEWRDALQAAGAEWHCWRPADLEKAIEVLR